MKKVRLGELLRTDAFQRRDKRKTELAYFDTSSITKGKIGEPSILKVGVDKIPSRAQNSIAGESVVYSLVRPLNEHHAFVSPTAIPDNSVFSTGYCGIKERGTNDLYYLYLLLTSKKSLRRLAQIADTSASSYPAISPSDIENLIVDYHDDYNYQVKIADLGKTIDMLFRNLELQISELEQTAQDLYNYWFVQFDFPDEKGNPYRSSGGKMVWNEELKQEIPEGWEVTNLDNFVSGTFAGDWGKESKQGNYTKEVYCLKGALLSGINENVHLELPPIRWILQSHADRLLEYGDIVIEISGGSPSQSTGRAALMSDLSFRRFDKPLVCSNFCRVLRLKESTLIPWFYQMWKHLYQNGVMFLFEGKTSGIKNLLLDFFMKQYKIAYSDDISKRASEYMLLMENHKQKLFCELQELSRMRSFLLPLLLNGQATIGSE